MCIKTLPPLLCIQLKRFGYDWEANRALKFDDYFKVSYESWTMYLCVKGSSLKSMVNDFLSVFQWSA